MVRHIDTYVLLLLLLLSLRWYGPGEPKKVFVERKTHRESWKVRRSFSNALIIGLLVAAVCRH
jgi:hypothetical protein